MILNQGCSPKCHNNENKHVDNNKVSITRTSCKIPGDNDNSLFSKL